MKQLTVDLRKISIFTISISLKFEGSVIRYLFEYFYCTLNNLFFGGTGWVPLYP